MNYIPGTSETGFDSTQNIKGWEKEKLQLTKALNAISLKTYPIEKQDSLNHFLTSRSICFLVNNLLFEKLLGPETFDTMVKKFISKLLIFRLY